MTYDDSNSTKLKVGDVKQEGDMVHGGEDYWFPTLFSGSPITEHSSETRRPFTAASEKDAARSTAAPSEPPAATDAVAAKSEEPKWVCQPNVWWAMKRDNKGNHALTVLQQAYLDTTTGAVEWRDVPHEEEK